MEKIEIAIDAVLDDVVEMLIKEKENGNHVFVIFDNVKLYSDNVTLDSAYQEIWGYTKKEFAYLYDGARARNGMKKRFGLTKENVLRNVIFSKLFFVTKNGKTSCYEAEEYINKMKQYDKYCTINMKKTWENRIRVLVYLAGEVDDYILLRHLEVLETAGEVMESMENGKTWDEIREIVYTPNHDDYFISLLVGAINEFSEKNNDFYLNVVCGKSDIHSKEVKKIHKEEMKKIHDAIDAHFLDSKKGEKTTRK